MKLNKLLILTAITGLAFTSCENEMKQDPELDVVATGDGVNYDGQTITVQKERPSHSSWAAKTTSSRSSAGKPEASMNTKTVHR